jgi:acyl carrier protein
MDKASIEEELKAILVDESDSKFDALKPHAGFSEELKLDGLELLNFLSAVEHAFRVSISEAEFKENGTLKKLVDLIATKNPTPPLHEQTF